jgi:hypothetical protein
VSVLLRQLLSALQTRRRINCEAPSSTGRPKLTSRGGAHPPGRVRLMSRSAIGLTSTNRTAPPTELDDAASLSPAREWGSSGRSSSQKGGLTAHPSRDRGALFEKKRRPPSERPPPTDLTVSFGRGGCYDERRRDVALWRVRFDRVQLPGYGSWALSPPLIVSHWPLPHSGHGGRL